MCQHLSGQKVKQFLAAFRIGFQGVEKAFRDGVVPAVAFMAHTLFNAMLLK
jgi:hypothetical protein